MPASVAHHAAAHAQHLHHRRRNRTASQDSSTDAPGFAFADREKAAAPSADSAPHQSLTVRRNARWGPPYVNLPARSVFSSLYQLLVDLPALQSITIMSGMVGAFTLVFGFMYAYLLPTSFARTDDSASSDLKTSDFMLYSLGVTTTLGEATCAPTRGTLGLAVANFQAVCVQLLLVFVTGVVFQRLSKPGLHMTLCRAMIFHDNNEHFGKCLTTRLLFDGPEDELIDVRITVTYVRHMTPTFIKSSVLKLVREDVPLLRVGTAVIHPIDDEDEPSPLAGETLETLKKRKAQFLLTVTGMERSTMQTVMFTRSYNLPSHDSPEETLAETENDAAGVVLDGTKFKLKDTTERISGIGTVLNFANLHKVVPL